MQNQKHYVCLGSCGGVSNMPGVCESVECEEYQNDLVSCICKDGNHAEIGFEEKKSEHDID